MSDYIKREDAIEIMACEMFAEAQAQGFPILIPTEERREP